MIPDTEIIIDTDDDFKIITLTFIGTDSNITVAFSINDAQMLSSYLNEAIMSVILKQKGTAMYQKSRTRH